MIFLILTISFNLLSTGNLQELDNANNFMLPQQNLGGPIPELVDQWPVQTIQTVQGNFFGQAFRNINSKPCSNRRNYQDLDEPWTPTFSSKIMKPIANFDNLNAPAIKEEIYGVPFDTPMVRNNILNDDENNIYNYKTSILFNDLTEKRIEDPIEVLGEIAPTDRTGNDITSFKENTLTLVNNRDVKVEQYIQDDTFPENMENELESKTAENKTENESKRDTVKISDECINKMNTTKEDNIKENSRRSMSSFEKHDSDSEEINKNAENELNNKKKLDKQGNNDKKNLPTAKEAKEGDKNQNASNMRKATRTKLMPNGKRPLQDSKNDLLEPTQGSGVSELSESRVMLMDYSRLCYACSTASNPTCWAPDRKTTVKYCRKGHEACVTKTFQTGNTLTLVRDCGSSCEDVDIPGFVPKYKSCSICHSDLCNSAYSINSRNVIFAFVLVTVIKCIY